MPQPPVQPTPRPETPAEAWQLLAEGNRRFVTSTSSHPNQDAFHRSRLASAQNPYAVIFGCSDSRLAAEIIFDVGLGDVFVVRTAGQVIDDAVLGSLEYSVSVLKTPLIVILGHDSCGAVTAAVEAFHSGQMPRGFVRDLVERITPSVIAARRQNVKDVNGTVTEHVKQTASRLADSSKIISDALDAGALAIAGVTYSLADGAVSLVSGLGSLTSEEQDSEHD
ncbi:carbonic anhydrase [Falsarthrobacter nasiphocae]|uniref:carbonic anhydrase n=1 Tax=Falsarthrobacter nasiphocae TaxID=189863 RepID=A0AAE4C5M0_9MICC|nr:carbonic anhydrase [Falsarthrobacter nasiphocae]MDR6891638.1 carbonic anhydrase [Falsarthrobacter nasiphocae]